MLDIGKVTEQRIGTNFQQKWLIIFGCMLQKKCIYMNNNLTVKHFYLSSMFDYTFYVDYPNVYIIKLFPIYNIIKY